MTAGDEQSNGSKEVLIRHRNKKRSIPAKDIFYIESRSRKVVLHLAEESIEYYDKIGKLEKELQPEFFRIHKGYLVNMKYIRQYGRTEILMRNGDNLLISKYRYQDFLQAYQKYDESREDADVFLKK